MLVPLASTLEFTNEWIFVKYFFYGKSCRMKCKQIKLWENFDDKNVKSKENQKNLIGRTSNKKPIKIESL